MINLVKNTINKDDIDLLINWLKTNPRLTKGEKTVEFEKKWSKWQNRKYSVFVNSGSSANLAIAYALLKSGRLKNKKIIIPSISWVTTVSPFIQLGYEPILCDADSDTLGIDINHLRALLINHKPAVLIIVHVLGFPNKMKEIQKLCNKENVILLEDSCESTGSIYNGKKTGNFGLMSSFSTYFGHHFSTIEGGIVNTDDKELYEILLSIRSHGWSRDLSEKTKKTLIKKYKTSSFKSLYTFYNPGFNLRSTDLQAFIGINQLGKLDETIFRRNQNFKLYDKLIKNSFWKIRELNNTFISNFAYPIITKNINKLAKNLQDNKIEIRPLVCGSIGKQPFWIDLYGERSLPFADIVNDYGLYLPNNPDLTIKEIEFICNIVNKNI